MAWKKLGNIFIPQRQKDWIRDHASLPVAFPLNKNIFRLFFSSRDHNNRSCVGYLDYDLVNLKVTYLSEKAVLNPGKTSSFDENGVSMGGLMMINDRLHLYYVGWGNIKEKGKFSNTIGLAIWDQNKQKFIKVSNDPVIGLDQTDPLNLSYPFILKTESGFSIWYGTNLSWGDSEKQMYHCIRSASSKDGIKWVKGKKPVIDLSSPEEFAILRPSIIIDEGLYKMWYCYKGDSYKIGYAESKDGLSWQRKDYEAIITKSSEQWENKEVAYPFVFTNSGQKYMLYNGNEYGKTGFGLAIWN